ncbi:MAG: Zn-ribbon domain-containing OB-fold protein [Achromobacter sp.]|uniref:Zn-ribbon domain-containing OB-fold protein n=1 Tax=Achromobacter sp. TaxID=134375 RepID=UPI003CFF2C82
METGKVEPAACGPQEQYFSALADGCFRIQRCEGCGQHQFFPRVLCVHCGATALSWIEPAGTGTVYSVSLVRRKPDAGGDYNVALIDLDEGVRLMSRIDEVPLDRLRIGMRVRARVSREGERALVAFAPAEAA